MPALGALSPSTHGSSRRSGVRERAPPSKLRREFADAHQPRTALPLCARPYATAVELLQLGSHTLWPARALSPLAAALSPPTTRRVLARSLSGSLALARPGQCPRRTYQANQCVHTPRPRCGPRADIGGARSTRPPSSPSTRLTSTSPVHPPRPPARPRTSPSSSTPRPAHTSPPTSGTRSSTRSSPTFSPAPPPQTGSTGTGTCTRRATCATANASGVNSPGGRGHTKKVRAKRSSSSLAATGPCTRS